MSSSQRPEFDGSFHGRTWTRHGDAHRRSSHGYGNADGRPSALQTKAVDSPALPPDVAPRMRLGDWLLQASRAARDFLLPLACACCARPVDSGEPGIVCGRCWARLVPLASPRCGRCGHSGDGTHRCRWCDLLPPFVRAARSVARVDAGTASAIVHALKYGGWPAVATGMAERMARLDWPLDVLEERTALVPVPLGKARLRARGYNQSGLLASELARRLDIPVWDDVLSRNRETRSQTRLTPEERKRNVFGAFIAPESHRTRLRGAHVIIVDDVITTGATLHACAEALFAGGARVISYVTFGRAPALGDQR